MRGRLFTVAAAVLAVAGCGESGPSSNICPEPATSVCLAPACLCRNLCTDLNVDPNNCGTCGVACNPGQVCVDGVCTCAGLMTKCGTECVEAAIDPSNCGQCGNVCSSGCCADGACSDLTDTKNCGACTNACGAGQKCVNGTCT